MQRDNYTTYQIRYVVSGVPFLSDEHSLEMAKKELKMLTDDEWTEKAELIEITRTEKVISIYKK